MKLGWSASAIGKLVRRVQYNLVGETWGVHRDVGGLPEPMDLVVEIHNARVGAQGALSAKTVTVKDVCRGSTDYPSALLRFPQLGQRLADQLTLPWGRGQGQGSNGRRPTEAWM